MIWPGILLCVIKAGVFSGLNLAIFTISSVLLEVLAVNGNRHASRLLLFRKGGHLTFTVILWDDVAVNVPLTRLSNSVMAGVSVLIFSTVVLTLLGESFPQACFSRRVLGIAAMVLPMLWF